VFTRHDGARSLSTAFFVGAHPAEEPTRATRRTRLAGPWPAIAFTSIVHCSDQKLGKQQVPGQNRGRDKQAASKDKSLSNL
jgi:hypothetical protein